MHIELICFGSELLWDKINTNVQIIAEHLLSIGYSLTRVTTVGDDQKEVEASLKEALKRSQIVLTCGGLGPTFDDLTREAVSKVLNKTLLYSKEILKKIEQSFQSVGIPMPEENNRQAYLIQGAKVLLNKVGTAPGQIIGLKNKHLILLPGPPKELSPMMEEEVLPFLRKKVPSFFIETCVLHIFGRPESEIDEKIKPVVEKKWNKSGLKVIFGILAHHSVVDVKVMVEGKNKKAVKKSVLEIEKEFYKILGNDIYGKNKETLESVIGRLLKKKEQTLAVAESCTGGFIANKITDIAGSSAYFKQGVVTYTDESKIKSLGVNQETLKNFGAVSEQTAKEMAKGILKRSNSDWGIAVTGIAGPTGDTKLKPVGMVSFGIASKNDSLTYTKIFHGTRLEIKEKSALMVLELLRKQLLK